MQPNKRKTPATIVAILILLFAFCGKILAIVDGSIFQSHSRLQLYSLILEFVVIVALARGLVLFGSLTLLLFSIGGILWTVLFWQEPCGCFGPLVDIDSAERLVLCGSLGALACINILGSLALRRK